MKKYFYLSAIVGISLVLFSCAGGANQQKGTGIGTGVGAGIGAILGQAIGRDTEGTLIGAGVGAIVGGLMGNQVGAYMDRQERDLRRALEASEAATVKRTTEAITASQQENVQRTGDLLAATFRSDVLFDFDSFMLKPGAYPELRRVADVLKKYPDTTVIVEGHTDTKGSETYNRKLSQDRARAVKDALVQSGVDPARITAVGYGESQPISSNDAVNRRVTMVIKPILKAVG
jgi:outer membrane protein OmpA-like peptidoglycan-associated protein